MIFDLGALSAISDVSQFVENERMREIISQWHVFMLLLSCGCWYGIVRRCETTLHNYYLLRYTRQHVIFPYAAWSAGWIGVTMIVLLHTAFFLSRIYLE